MNVGERQRKLGLWAEQLRADADQGLFKSRDDLRLYDLYHLVYEPTWLRLAHDHVAQNSGSVTAGCDGISMAKFDENLDENLQQLGDELRNGTFRPYPVRRVMIPKKNGKLRPLGIPSIRDRIVQESLRMVLEPIFEAEFYEHSYGFRPNRSTIDALATIVHRSGGRMKYFWVIEGDIKSYFDTIHHTKLMQLLRRRIRDEKLLRLVWRFLRAGVMEGGLFTPTTEGTPQGGIISPLLANVYLHELDMFMARKVNRPRAMKQHLRWHGHANFVHVRYADDFVVMCNGTKEQTEAMKQELQRFLADELHLTLSEEKTKITHIDDGFKFLGYDVQRGIVGSGEKFPKLLIPNEAVREIRAKILEITAQSSCAHSFDAKLIALNRIIRGWAGYYRYAHCGSRVFAKLDALLFWRLVHWLGAKYRCKTTEVMSRHYQRVKGVMALTSGTQTLVRMSSVPYCLPLLRKLHNPYTTNHPQLSRAEGFALPSWLGNEPRPGVLDLRPLVLERDGWACQHCGQAVAEDTVTLDHIRPVRRFKRPVDANTLDNLQTLCIPCHKRKTARRD
jgi:group II intron reverse transcriptase/maturase